MKIKEKNENNENDKNNKNDKNSESKGRKMMMTDNMTLWLPEIDIMTNWI